MTSINPGSIKNREYLHLSLDVYSRNAATTFRNWTVHKREFPKGRFRWKDGHNSDGFGGAIYTNGRAVVVAFMGSNLVEADTSDVHADLRIMSGIMPSQAGEARRLYEDAVQLANQTSCPPPVITGHSLGGALAQAVGYWQGARFVTYNAPGMYQIVVGSHANIFRPKMLVRSWKRTAKGRSDEGVNYRVANDPIGKFGKHVGKVIKLSHNNGGKWTGAKMGLHDIGPIRRALGSTRLKRDPFTDS